MQSGGKQTDWQAVRESTDLPIITIITSTFNAVNDLPWTIDSIKNQTYPHIQWIVADGASKDNTVAMLQENSDVIDYWFSEPDTGIYDAWNKAIKHVKGDWVQFLGAGDELYEVTTLAQIANYLQGAYPQYEIAYGKVAHISEKGRKELYVSGERWERYKNKWQVNRPALPPHQGVYHHVSIFKKLSFDTQFRIVADTHLLLQCLNKDFKYIPISVSKMPRGGLSTTPKGGLASYSEVEKSINLLKIKLPPLINLKSKLHYNIGKLLITMGGEQGYAYIVDTVKTLQGKPKLYTIN